MPHQATKNGVKNGNNRIFTSIHFVSAIKLINTTLDTAEASLQSFQEKSKESHNREAKKCVRDVGKALRDIRHYTNIITNDIVSVYTKGSATSYNYKRIASSGALPSHISIAILAPIATPTKQISRSQTPNLPLKIVMPNPSKGNAYTPLQAMEWMSVEKHALSVAKRLKMMIDRKYVPIGRSTMYDIFKNTNLPVIALLSGISLVENQL